MPYYGRPLKVGHFSTDGDNAFLNDDSRLRFLKLPPPSQGLAWDLNSGYETWRPDDSYTFLRLVCAWIGGRGAQSLSEAVSGSEFVCWRGCLMKMAATPYEQKQAWCIAISKLHGVHFLTEYDAPQTAQLQLTGQARRMTYWGHRFEAFVAADRSGNLDLGSPVNSLETFSVVTKGRLAEHRLLLAAETDAQDPVSGDFVELKIQRHFSSEGSENSFYRWKAFKWWLQCFLAGVPRIVAGLRDDNGIVSQLREWRVSDLPRDSRWSAAVALQFAAALLRLVKETLKDVTDPSQVYLLEYEPGSRWVSAPRLRTDPSSFAVLPSEFVAKFS